MPEQINFAENPNLRAIEAPETQAHIEFKAGPVIITNLSPSPDGFEVVTAESIGRTSAAEHPLRLNADQAARLSAAYQGPERDTMP
jgi:hypothetical protein